MPFELTSSAIRAHEDLPIRFSCDGAHISPPLTWSGAPQNTATFALVVDDPDAPHGVFTHWLLFNIPADLDHLDAPLPQRAGATRQQILQAMQTHTLAQAQLVAVYHRPS